MALASGGRQFFGYDAKLAALDNIFDAINVNTKATGQWKKGKAPDFPLAQRPSRASGSADTDEKPSKLAALYKRFTGGN